MKKQSRKDSLVGRFFHTISKEGKIQYQGHFLSKIKEGYYLTEYFDYAMGHPSSQQIIKVEDMTNWLIYDDAEQMKYSYEHGRAYSLRSGKA